MSLPFYLVTGYKSITFGVLNEKYDIVGFNCVVLFNIQISGVKYFALIKSYCCSSDSKYSSYNLEKYSC